MINNFRGSAPLKRQLESVSSVNEIKIVSLARLALLEEQNCIGLNWVAMNPFLFALHIKLLHRCNNLNGLKRLIKTFGSSNLKQITVNN